MSLLGGAQLFEESFFHPWFDTLHLTQLSQEFECDVYLPERMREALKERTDDLERFVVENDIEENGVKYRIVEYKANAKK